jgi:indolepyruvate ferredoxin oxidoreductase
VTKTVVTLSDKYTQAEGQVMLSALQGVVRLLLDQGRRDRAAGLTTAGYVTGYRGSPVTTLDAQLWANEKLLTEHDIRFEPGLNEELAATSLRGTQQLGWYGKPRVDGVYALWYPRGLWRQPRAAGGRGKTRLYRGAIGADILRDGGCPRAVGQE